MDEHRLDGHRRSLWLLAVSVASVLLFLIALAPQAFAGINAPPIPVPEEPAALDNLLGAGVVLLGVVLTRRGIGRLLRNL